MFVYLSTWFSVMLFGHYSEKYDFRPTNALTDKRIHHSKNANTFFSISVLILILVAGLRYYVGADYYAYYGWYSDYASSFIEHLKNLDEPGLRLIYWLTVNLIADDGAACVFITNAIIIFLVVKTLHDNTDQLFLPIVLYSLICWTDTFNGMRQVLAAAVVFCSLSALRDKKFIKFCIIIFLAFLCHKSALVMLPVYFLVHRKTNIINLLILAILSYVLLISSEQLFDISGWILGKEINAESAYSSRSVNILRILSNIAPAAFFLILYSPRKKKPLEDFYLNLLVIHALFSIITQNSAYLARVNIFSAPFEIIAICELLKGEKRLRQLYTVLIIGLFLIFESYQVLSSSDLTPFKWIWER